MNILPDFGPEYSYAQYIQKVSKILGKMYGKIQLSAKIYSYSQVIHLGGYPFRQV